MQGNMCLLATSISNERKARSKFPIHTTCKALRDFQ